MAAEASAEATAAEVTGVAAREGAERAAEACSDLGYALREVANAPVSAH